MIYKHIRVTLLNSPKSLPHICPNSYLVLAKFKPTYVDIVWANGYTLYGATK